MLMKIAIHIVMLMKTVKAPIRELAMGIRATIISIVNIIMARTIQTNNPYLSRSTTTLKFFNCTFSCLKRCS